MQVHWITKGCVWGEGGGDGRDAVLLEEVPHLSIILVQIGDKEGGGRNVGGMEGGRAPLSFQFILPYKFVLRTKQNKVKFIVHCSPPKSSYQIPIYRVQ